MAGELNVSYAGSGTPYAVIRKQSTGQVWNGSAFATWANGSITTYATNGTLTSQGGDYWTANFPSGISNGTVCDVLVYENTGTATITDLLLRTYTHVAGSATASSVAGSGMTLTTARAIVRAATRSGNDPDDERYSNTDIDYAILTIGDDFVRRTQCIVQTSSVSLVADSWDDIDFSGVTNFAPDDVLAVLVDESANYTASDVESELTRVGIADISRLRFEYGESSGVPAYIGWESASTARVHPPPKAAGTMTVQWIPPFTVFTPGTGTPDSVVLNIPYKMIYPVLVHGAAVLVQFPEVENINRDQKLALYNEHVASCMGRVASLGARTSYRPREG